MIFTKLLRKLYKLGLTKIEGDIYFSPFVLSSFRTVLDGLDWKLEHGGGIFAKHNKLVQETNIKLISEFTVIENCSDDPQRKYKANIPDPWEHFVKMFASIYPFGDWHTHPSGGIVPSPDDDKVMFKKSKLRGIPWYLGIVGIKGAGHIPILSESGLIMSAATIMLYELKLWEYYQGERKEIAEIII